MPKAFSSCKSKSKTMNPYHAQHLTHTNSFQFLVDVLLFFSNLFHNDYFWSSKLIFNNTYIHTTGESSLESNIKCSHKHGKMSISYILHKTNQPWRGISINNKIKNYLDLGSNPTPKPHKTLFTLQHMHQPKKKLHLYPAQAEAQMATHECRDYGCQRFEATLISIKMNSFF